MTKVRHITFGTVNMTRSVRRLRASSARFGIKTYAYTRHHPVVADLARRYPEIMSQPRGGGYWLWKPAIILHALENCPDDTIVLYTDAGMHMVGDPAPLLAHALAHPIMLFEHTFPIPDGPISYPTGLWTKRDCFVLLGGDTPAVHQAQQLMSGVQIYRNGPQARDFLRETFAATADSRVLTDQPNTQGLDNLPGFREHRHDQSVLTIVACRHDLPHFPDPTQYGHNAPRPALSRAIDGIDRPAANYGLIFDLHRKRDRGVLTMIWSRLNPIRSGRWTRCEVDLALT